MYCGAGRGLKRFVRGRFGAQRTLSARLRQELSNGTGWMYPWNIDSRRETPLLHPELASVHRTRARCIEPIARKVLRDAGAEGCALDLACGEGWFGHQLLRWGAGRVLGVDIRRRNIERARLMREHYGVEPSRLSFLESDIFHMDPEELGSFHVVLVLGLVYHLEDPVGALRRARALTRCVCLIESQLTRMSQPIAHGWGATDSVELAPASFAAKLEGDSPVNPLAASTGTLSLIPNRAALELSARVAGFSRIEVLDLPSGSNPQYVRGDRALFAAWR